MEIDIPKMTNSKVTESTVVKGALQSKTIWGLIVVLADLCLSMLESNTGSFSQFILHLLPDWETAPQIAMNVTNWSLLALGVIGGKITFKGRVDANSKLKGLWKKKDAKSK